MSKKISLNGLGSLIVKLKTVFLTEDDERLLMDGPDGGKYKLVLDEDFRLTVEEKMPARKVTYFIVNEEYYYLEEDASGIHCTKYEGTPEEDECGVIVAISKDSGMKFIAGVENGNITFTLCEDQNAIIQNSAKYITCNDKVCYFQIENDNVQIYYEYNSLILDNTQIK